MVRNAGQGAPSPDGPLKPPMNRVKSGPPTKPSPVMSAASQVGLPPVGALKQPMNRVKSKPP